MPTHVNVSIPGISEPRRHRRARNAAGPPEHHACANRQDVYANDAMPLSNEAENRCARRRARPKRPKQMQTNALPLKCSLDRNERKAVLSPRTVRCNPSPRAGSNVTARSARAKDDRDNQEHRQRPHAHRHCTTKMSAPSRRGSLRNTGPGESRRLGVAHSRHSQRSPQPIEVAVGRAHSKRVLSAVA